MPEPLLLIAAGIAVSFVPGVPEVVLGPEVVLLGLLPPLLYAAALQTSLVDFTADRRPILLLSVGLVAFTTVGVGAVVHALLPGVSWAAALAIGAVVALDFAVAAGGGVAAYLLAARLRRDLDDPLVDGGLSLLTPFAVFVAAEEIHASGVLAVVVAGLLLGHRAPVLQTAQSRIADRMNWRTVAFVLENAVFLLIGLQGRWIVEDVAGSEVPPGRIALVCVVTLAAVVVLRMLWVFPSRFALCGAAEKAPTVATPGPTPSSSAGPACARS